MNGITYPGFTRTYSEKVKAASEIYEITEFG